MRIASMQPLHATPHGAAVAAAAAAARAWHEWASCCLQPFHAFCRSLQQCEMAKALLILLVCILLAGLAR